MIFLHNNTVGLTMVHKKSPPHDEMATLQKNISKLTLVLSILLFVFLQKLLLYITGNKFIGSKLHGE